MKSSFAKILFQAILVGLFTGVVVVLFRLGIENLFDFVKNNFYDVPVIFVLIAILGALISGILVYKIAPETSGSGIPYVKMVLLRSGKLVRIRTIFVKFFAGILGIGTGLSLGREGPSVQLGAGVGSLIGKAFKIKGSNRDKLIASGAGAAISATFNAPIAGVLFVLEELIHRFSPSILFPTLTATVISAIVARNILGDNPIFNIVLSKITLTPSVILFCVVLGIVSGFLGVLFSKTIFFFNKRYANLKIKNYYKPAIAGFIVACVGLYVPYILSSGNNTVELLLLNKFSILMVCVIFILKFILTPICFSSGAAGGIFLPMLMLGALLGYILGYFAQMFGLDINLGISTALGMASFLSAVARTPLTAVVMVFEMTGGYSCILPIMLTTALADIVAEKLKHKPIYAQLVVSQYEKFGIMPEDKLVKDVMKTDVETIKDDVSIINALDTMQKTKKNFYPVVFQNDELCGVITKSSIEDVLIDEKMKNIPVNRIVDTDCIIVLDNENLYKAYYRLHETSEEYAVIVNNKNNVVGVLSRKDVLDI